MIQAYYAPHFTSCRYPFQSYAAISKFGFLPITSSLGSRLCICLSMDPRRNMEVTDYEVLSVPYLASWTRYKLLWKKKKRKSVYQGEYHLICTHGMAKWIWEFSHQKQEFLGLTERRLDGHWKIGHISFELYVTITKKKHTCILIRYFQNLFFLPANFLKKNTLDIKKCKILHLAAL